jgi:capsid protein
LIRTALERFRDWRSAAVAGGEIRPATGAEAARRLWRKVRDRAFTYDAVNPKNKRRAPTGRLLSEDRELMADERRLLVSSARDVHRNFVVAAWAIRKHLDFVSSFNFQPNTGDEGFDKDWSEAVARWSLKKNFDAAKRHGRQRFLRLNEARRCVDGDIFSMKLKAGALQAIEGDRIRNPLNQQDQVFDPGSLGNIPPGMIQGVVTDRAGAPQAYAVNRRTMWGTFEFERMVSAENMLAHGFYDRFDQVRGISPLTPALHTLQDCYEGFDYALAKLKIAQLFGLVIFRDAVESAGNIFSDPTPANDDDDVDESDTDTPTNGTGYNVDFGSGPVLLDLDAGDKAEFLENKTPSEEFQAFTQMMIALSIKCLDLPYSFYDEAYTNFFGSRAALILYLMSARAKQADNREWLVEWLLWRTSLAILSGELRMPRSLGTVEELRGRFDWVHSGVPWWDPEKEIYADLAAIAGGIRTRTEIRRERFGDSWDEMIERRAAEDEKMQGLGIAVVMPTTISLLPEGAEQSDTGEADQIGNGAPNQNGNKKGDKNAKPVGK